VPETKQQIIENIEKFIEIENLLSEYSQKHKLLQDIIKKQLMDLDEEYDYCYYKGRIYKASANGLEIFDNVVNLENNS
jgi:hypothetical protein